MTDNKEREAFEAAWLKAYPLHEKTVFTRSLLNPHEYAGTRVNDGWKMWQARAALAASQEKAEPVAWFTDDYLTDKSATTWDRSVAERWREKGWPVTPIYATPVAAHADMRECRHCGWMCAPNAAKSKRWYPLAEPVAAQASEPICYLWLDPVTKRYEVDHCTHPTNELVPVYAAPQPSAETVRDAALEEAANTATGFLVGDPLAGIPLRNPMTHEIADAIRALKSAPPQPADAAQYVEALDVENHRLRHAMQKVMARLTNLLDEDQFGNIESIVEEAGVTPPQPAEKPSAPMWVSVNDRLPPLDSDKRILVYTEGADFDGEQFFDIKADDLYPTPDGEDDTRTEVAACVTHWMERPIPRPAINTKSASPAALTVSQAFLDKFKAATRATNPYAVMTLVDEANDLLARAQGEQA